MHHLVRFVQENATDVYGQTGSYLLSQCSFVYEREKEKFVTFISDKLFAFINVCSGHKIYPKALGVTCIVTQRYLLLAVTISCIQVTKRPISFVLFSESQSFGFQSRVKTCTVF